MFYKIAEVKPMADFLLMIQFESNIKKLYDVKPLFIKWEEFKVLSNSKGLFEQVKVDAGGYGISWNDSLDLSCNELWNNGEILD